MSQPDDPTNPTNQASGCSTEVAPAPDREVASAHVTDADHGENHGGDHGGGGPELQKSRTKHASATSSAETCGAVIQGGRPAESASEGSGPQQEPEEAWRDHGGPTMAENPPRSRRMSPLALLLVLASIGVAPPRRDRGAR